MAAVNARFIHLPRERERERERKLIHNMLNKIQHRSVGFEELFYPLGVVQGVE